MNSLNFSSSILLQIWLAISLLIAAKCETFVTINNNGYSGIVVAFAPSISEKEGYPLIKNIKELFTNGSHSLYNATRKRAYFHSVNILVPRTWGKRPEYKLATSETFDHADIRIDNSTSGYGDGPFTLQPMPCGHGGEYIQLTTGYLKNLYGNSTTLFGDPGKTLVHEWAHYRYGIFDEFGYPGHPQFPLFYIDPLHEKIKPNYCANEDLNGPYINPDNDRSCRIGIDGLPEDNCIFIPNLDTKANSSLGSYHYLPMVGQFCDDEFHKHNSYAPNKHNLLCNERSTWSVISENEDFKNKNQPAEYNSSNLKPTFTIVQQAEPRFILVLDLSSSMKTGEPYSRINMLTDTVRRWIFEEVRIGWTIGIVTFDEKAHDLQKPIKMDTDEHKVNISKKVPTETKAGSSTCIGCGIQNAIKLLGKGGTIILVSDGEENKPPFVKSIVSEITKSRVRIIAIAISQDTSPALETAAKVSGGKAFFVSSKTGILAMGSAFHEATTYQETDIDSLVQVSEKNFSNTETMLNGNFTIDSTIGNDTTINIYYQLENDIETVAILSNQAFDKIEVLMPTSTNSVGSAKYGARQQMTGFSEGSSSFIQDVKLFRFSYSNLKPGQYNYTIKRKGLTNQMIVVQVLSKSATAMKPITTRCWMGKEIDAENQATRLIVYAEVKQGTNPIVKATVRANIVRPDGQSITLQLFDNGNGAPDITRNDGIYSRYFTKLGDRTGRYTVKATVIGNGASSIREMGFTASRSMPIANKYMNDNLKFEDKPTGSFERSSDGGSFTVGVIAKSKKYPPSRVTDLVAENVTSDFTRVSIKWTAPGDDLDEGRAANYSLKYSTNRRALREEFNGTLLETDEPLPAGQIESHTFILEELANARVLYLALRTMDRDSQWSRISNIVEIRGKAPINDGSDESNVGRIIGIVVAVLVVCAAIILVAWLVIKRRRRGNL